MNLQFKFNLFGIITFLVLGGLFYAFVPLPSNTVWRAVVCLGAAAALFAMCFVVVTTKSIIRRK